MSHAGRTGLTGWCASDTDVDGDGLQEAIGLSSSQVELEAIAMNFCDEDASGSPAPRSEANGWESDKLGTGVVAAGSLSSQ